jgi:hypothetical protein
MSAKITGRLRNGALGLALIATLTVVVVAAIPDANSQGLGPIVRRVEGQSDFNNWNRVTWTATCPSGFYVISGGGRIVNSRSAPNARELYLRGSFPFENGWRVEGQSIKPSSARWALHVWAVCSNA